MVEKPQEIIQIPEQIEAAQVINSLHVSWIYLNPESRKRYRLKNRYAFYHSETNIDYINKLEKELQKLNLKEYKDYEISRTDFEDFNIFTICLTEKSSQRLEQFGISVIEKLS